MTIDELFAGNKCCKLTIEHNDDGKSRFVADVKLDDGGYIAFGDTPDAALLDLLALVEQGSLAKRAESKTACDRCGGEIVEKFYDRRGGAFCSKAHRDYAAWVLRISQRAADAIEQHMADRQRRLSK